eukprot:EG_transcript_9041
MLGQDAPEEVPFAFTAVEDWSHDAAQRAHMIAIFSADHPLRYPVPSSLALSGTIALLRRSLPRLVAVKAFTGVVLALQHRRRAKRLIWGVFRNLRAEREVVLTEWLQYWRGAEGKVHTAYRDQFVTAPRVWSTRKVATPTLVHAMTPDPVKVHVLWELYWALRLQFLFRLRQHHRRCAALVELRPGCRKGSRQWPPHNAFHDVDASPLAKLDATLFVEIVQRPVFRYISGQQVKFSELVKLSNSVNVFHEHWTHVSSGLRHVPPVLLAFLKLPLCIEAEWLQQRFAMRTPIVPPLSWFPPHPPVKVAVSHPFPTPSEISVESHADSLYLQVPPSMPAALCPSKRQAALLHALKGSERSPPRSPSRNSLHSPHVPIPSLAPKPVGKLPELPRDAPRITVAIVAGGGHSASRPQRKLSKYCG